ncbi:hypothetical protein EDD29_6788 [Actinocorallia herbida]|uniref:FHA domain-containing protein n=1 Tax=Actinocorallia herbida TaxID=58109 RepID=A0A3N1D6D5_9ACTN|nr:FHA domain-containing protein [Actinocorallia herbida]ROO89101.1 hypothetical protein EDD29_6788 [Actinocorallia herbida]
MALDHLTLDIESADFIVDLSNVVRNTSLGRGAARLDRFDGLIEGLRRFARDTEVSVYAVADRALLHDRDLTPGERAALQEWAAAGLIEVRPVADDRILEIADLADRMIVTDDNYKEYHRAYPWLTGNRDRFLGPRPDPREPGAVTVRRRTIPEPPEWELSLSEENREIKDAGLRGKDAERLRRTLLGRRWECPEPGCPLFGRPRRGGQPLARFTRKGAVCPTHGGPLADRGRAPRRAQVKVLIEGTVVIRFTLEEGATTPVGRAPLGGGIPLASWLGAGALASMSRSHVELICAAEGVFVRDISSNGTNLRNGDTLTRLTPGRRHTFGPRQEVVLHESVALTLSGRRYFSGEDDEPPPTPPAHADPTMREGRDGRVTGTTRGGRRRGRR